MNVLHITTHFPPMKGGVESTTKSFVDFLEDRGIKSYTLTYESGLVAREKFSDYWIRSNIIRVSVPYGLLKYMIDLRYISETAHRQLFYRLRYVFLHEFFLLMNALFHLEEFKKCDLIVGQGAVIEGVCAFIVSKLLRKRYILRIHTDITLFLSNAFSRRLLQMILSNAQMLIVNGDDIKERISKLGIRPENIIVASHRIDTTIFFPRDKIPMRKKHGLPTDSLIAIFVGGLNLTKLCDMVIQVANIVLEQDRDVVFLFIGEGPLKEQVDELVERFSGNVRFINRFLPQETLAEYLSASDVFLIGSVDVSYPSRMVLECLACGTPVIIPNAPIYLEKRGEKIRFKLDSPLLYVLSLNPVEIAKFIVNGKNRILADKENQKYKIDAFNYVSRKHSADELEKYFDTILKTSQSKPIPLIFSKLSNK